MTISPHSLDLLTKITTGNFHTRNLPVPSEDTVEAYLAEQNVLPACPRCAGTEVKRNGKFANRQRLRCKRCGKTFGLSSGTPYYRSKHPYSIWREAICCFERKIPLREIAEHTGVSTHTLCRWRQRYLAWHLRALMEVLETLQEKGMLEKDTDIQAISLLIKKEMNRVYRGRSRKLAEERLLRWQRKWLEKQGVKLGLFPENNISIQNHPMVPQLPSTKTAQQRAGFLDQDRFMYSPEHGEV